MQLHQRLPPPGPANQRMRPRPPEAVIWIRSAEVVRSGRLGQIERRIGKRAGKNVVSGLYETRAIIVRARLA